MVIHPSLTSYLHSEFILFLFNIYPWSFFLLLISSFSILIYYCLFILEYLVQYVFRRGYFSLIIILSCALESIPPWSFGFHQCPLENCYLIMMFLFVGILLFPMAEFKIISLSFMSCNSTKICMWEHFLFYVSMFHKSKY